MGSLAPSMTSDPLRALSQPNLFLVHWVLAGS